MNLFSKRSIVALTLSLLVVGSSIERSNGLCSPQQLQLKKSSSYSSTLPSNPLLSSKDTSSSRIKSGRTALYYRIPFSKPSLQFLSESSVAASSSAVAFNDKNDQTTSGSALPSRTQRARRSFYLPVVPLAILLMAMFAVPLRATATAVAQAATVSAPAATTTATTAATVARSTSCLATAITAASPVPADVEMKLAIRLLYAALMGAALGKERSFAKHSAGVRTMALVAMGASAFTICSAFGFLAFGHYDPSRMASNVASGVGFVGAGVITTTGSNGSQNVVHGLTTAATIWLSAAVGVACGVGLFRIATTAAATTIAILRLGRIKPKSHPSPVHQSSVRYMYKNNQQQRRQQQPYFEQANSHFHEDHVEDQAETHDTSVWDEHHESHEPIVTVQEPIMENHETRILPTTEAVPEESFVPKKPKKKIVIEDDPNMEQVVKMAWQNATIQNQPRIELVNPPRTGGRRP